MSKQKTIPKKPAGGRPPFLTDPVRVSSFWCEREEREWLLRQKGPVSQTLRRLIANARALEEGNNGSKKEGKANALRAHTATGDTP